MSQIPGPVPTSSQSRRATCPCGPVRMFGADASPCVRVCGPAASAARSTAHTSPTSASPSRRTASLTSDRRRRSGQRVSKRAPTRSHASARGSQGQASSACLTHRPCRDASVLAAAIGSAPSPHDERGPPAPAPSIRLGHPPESGSGPSACPHRAAGPPCTRDTPSQRDRRQLSASTSAANVPSSSPSIDSTTRAEGRDATSDARRCS